VIRVVFALLALVVNDSYDSDDPAQNPRLRPQTPVEAAWSARILATVRPSLPPIPKGFELATQVEPDPTFIDREIRNEPWAREFLIVTWDRKRAEAHIKSQVVPDDKAAQAAQQAAMDKANADLQPKMDALVKRLQAAAARNDAAEVERIQSQMERLGAEVAKTAGQIDGMLPKATASRAKDVRFSIRIAINERRALQKGHKPAGKVGGSTVYVRDILPDEPIEEESEAVVMLGAWDSDPDSKTMTARWNAPLPHTVAQNIVVEVRGDPARAQAYLKAIRWEKLRSLLKP
jgi:hypothetical protein